MPLLVNHKGEPLEDSKGQQIKAGSTVVHEFLGEGIATGTVFRSRKRRWRQHHNQLAWSWPRHRRAPECWRPPPDAQVRHADGAAAYGRRIRVWRGGKSARPECCRCGAATRGRGSAAAGWRRLSCSAGDHGGCGEPEKEPAPRTTATAPPPATTRGLCCSVLERRKVGVYCLPPLSAAYPHLSAAYQPRSAAYTPSGPVPPSRTTTLSGVITRVR